MLQYNPSITGSLQVTGSISVTGNIIASGSITISGSVASASYAEFLGGLPSSSFASASVFNTVSSSYAAASASLSTRVTTLESASGSFAAQSASLSIRVTNLEATSSTISSSFASTSGSIAGRVTCIEGQYATTGSNNFSGRQYVSDVSNAIGFTSTASIYTDGGLRVSKDSFVSGTAYFNNVVVYGTSSIEYITSSQLAIGTNIITLNTDTPSIRYGGISVFDSGSNNQSTGSLFWDSEKDKWIYSNPSGSTYDGGMLISGPRNSSGLGNEVGTTSCAVMIGQGGDHITSSGIFSYGNATCFYGNSFISSSGAMCIGGSLTGTSATFTGSLNITGSNSILNVGCVGIGIENPVTKLHVNGNIISEGCFFSGAPDNLRIFAGYWSTVSGNGNCYLVFQAGGGNASFGTPQGWGGTASIYSCGQTRLSINTNGIACFACQVCAPQGIFINGATSLQAQFGQNNDATGTQTSAIDIISRNAANTAGFTFRIQNCATTCTTHLVYSGNSVMVFRCNGNVGINTTTPCAKLDVSYTGTETGVRLVGGSGACCGNMFRSYISDYSDGSPINLFWANHGSTARTNTLVRIHTNETSAGGYPLRITAQGSLCSPTYEALSVNYLGYVGIGTCNPQYLLEIPRGNNLYLGNLYITGCNLGPVLSSGGTGGSICLQGGGAGEGAIHLQGGTSGNGFIRFLTNSTTVRMTIANDGVSCFQNTVCAPRFVGPVTGNLTGFAILANTSCTLGGSSSDVTIYFTSGFRIEYGINDYTVFAYLAGNSAVNSSLRALIPYNYYQSSTTTTNLASYIDTPNSNSALAVAICKLASSNTYCIAVRFAVSSGNVSGYVIQLTSNGIQSGFA